MISGEITRINFLRKLKNRHREIEDEWRHSRELYHELIMQLKARKDHREIIAMMEKIPTASYFLFCFLSLFCNSDEFT